MPSFVKCSQSFVSTSGTDAVTQHYTATENGTIVFDADVAITDSASDPVTFWAEVGSTLGRALHYVDAAGNATPDFTDSQVLADTFAGPAPAGFADITEVDQRVADERPVD